MTLTDADTDAHARSGAHADTGAAALPGTGRRRRGWSRALRRTPGRIWHDDVMDWAAALTYYGVLAIFPTLLVIVSLMSLTGRDLAQGLVRQLTAAVPEAAHPVLTEAVTDMTGRPSAAWTLAGIGTAGALWSASTYLAVFRRALHTMHGVKDTHAVWQRIPRIVLTALLLLALLAASSLAVLLIAAIAGSAGALTGPDTALLTAWYALRWPLLTCLVAVLVLLLFRTGPPGTRSLRDAGPGGVLAVVLWLGSSGGFALYVANVGTFSRLYGSFAGLIVFLVWLWLSNLALLTGAQFNVELRRVRDARGPHPSGRTAEPAPRSPS